VAILDLISSIVSRPAGRVLEGPVRNLVNDLIRDHDLASAAEVDTVRRKLRDLQDRADQLQQELDSSQGQVAELKDALAATQAQLDQTRAEPAGPAPAAAPQPEPAPAEAEPDPDPLGCRVPGCEGRYRSKGFCSPHYQRWRRGTLPGFVLPAGTVTEGKRSWKPGKKLAGQPYQIQGDKLVVGDQSF